MLFIVPLAANAAEPELARLLRYPDISRTEITFVHGGDLFVVPREGGVAQRLTSSPGEELYPKFSPDGQWIAFAAEYSGTRQLWVIPAAGGTPRQLTWYNDIGTLPVRGGTDCRVLDWTPDGSSILVRLNRVPWDDRGGRPYLVPLAGGLEIPLPIPETGGGSLSPDGSQFVYTPIDADWRGWKRYRGGRAPDVWVIDLKATASRQLTTFRGLDQNPAWIGDDVYFASDRTGTANLYTLPASATEESVAPRPLTAFTDFDVLWPSGGPDAIVFEHGGTLWRYDAGASSAVQVPVRLVDDAPLALPHYVSITDTIESYGMSPDGSRAVFSARGEIFTVPAHEGEPRNVTRTPSAHERSVSWSPDGRSLAWLSDASGEYEIEIGAQDGSAPARRITADGTAWKFPPAWSPDGQSFAYADRDQRLFVVDIRRGTATEIDRSDRGDLTEYTWSPDSQWLVYARLEPNDRAALRAWSAKSGLATTLTAGPYDEFSPIFDPKGRYLYFLSNRDFEGLTYGAFDNTYLYRNATRIYAATLDPSAPPLNAYRSDEVAVGPQKEKSEKTPKEAPVRVTFDPAAFEARVVALDLPGAGYTALRATADAVLFLDDESLKQFPIAPERREQRKAEVICKDVTDYHLSADGKKALVRTKAGFSIVDVKADQDAAKGALALDRIRLRIDPRVEWQQMYVDAWRIIRDWFYDPGVHGGLARWTAIRDRYAPLAAAVTTPGDFEYVLHELGGEVHAGHIYVDRGPRSPGVERTAGGLLGAEFEPDPSGYFRITKIFSGEPWNEDARSPLATPGIGARVGDYLLSVNGIDLTTVKNPYQALEGTGGRAVTLRLNDRPSGKGARTVTVVTVESEQQLRYLDWIAERRAMVDRLSAGRIGYFHLANTAGAGNAQLNTWLPALQHKEALIIDDRYNGGGFIPDLMVAQLARTPLSYWKARGRVPSSSPSILHRGPKAMLINGLSSSGGDALPYYFRALGLGPLVGTRTWGGLIGLSGNPSLANGSSLSVATFRFMTADGQWAVENEGVEPDVQIVDRPELVAAGRDPSLEKAVELLLQELAAHPVPPVVAPPPPTEFR